MDTTQVNHISLCAGYGGIDLGLRRAIGARLRTIAYSEIEAYAVENLLARMESGAIEAAPIWSDLKTFPWSAFYGLVDILSGGYPCQPFSTAGKRAGSEDPRHLWPYIASGIRILQPRLCFFENVEGHVSLGLSTVISDLEGLGYRATWGLFSAAEVGAPHQRKRVFILAHREGTRLERHDGLLARCGESRWQSPQQKGQACGGNRGADVWPARPGQQQFPWEPPRVVGNTGGNGRWEDQQGREAEERVAVDWSSEGLGNSNSVNGSTPTAGWQHDAKAGCSSGWKTQPELGGNTDGVAHRVDRLRLLGNGVVPQTAEKAFLTLIARFENRL